MLKHHLPITLLVFLITFAFQSYGQVLKEVTGYLVEEGNHNPRLFMKEKYNKQGLLVEDEYPIVHMGCTYKYDSLKRLISRAGLWASEAEATLTYQYFPDKTCAILKTSTSYEKTCDFFDAKGNVIKHVVFKYLGNNPKAGDTPVSITQNTYTYDYQGNKIVKKSEKKVKSFSNFGKDSILQASYFIYTPQDSLQSITVKNAQNVVVRKEVFERDPKSHQVTAHVKYGKNNVVKATTKYQYQNGHLYKEAYSSGDKVGITQYLYNKGQIMKMITTEKYKHKFTEQRTYYYTYW